MPVNRIHTRRWRTFPVRFDMKKVFALALTLALLLAGLPPLRAQTEQHAELTANVKPVENQDGNVVLEIDVTVKNGAPEQAISLVEFRYENELIASVDSISARSSAFVRSVPLHMSLTAMTSDVEVEVSYIDFNGEAISRWMVVQGEQAEPKLSFKRVASATAVSAGESVKLTYMVKNEGSVLLSDLQITDDLPGVGEVGRSICSIPAICGSSTSRSNWIRT